MTPKEQSLKTVTCVSLTELPARPNVISFYVLKKVEFNDDQNLKHQERIASLMTSKAACVENWNETAQCACPLEHVLAYI